MADRKFAHLHDAATGECVWRQGLLSHYDEHSAWPLYSEPHLLFAAGRRPHFGAASSSFAIRRRWSACSFARRPPSTRTGGWFDGLHDGVELPGGVPPRDAAGRTRCENAAPLAAMARRRGGLRGLLLVLGTAAGLEGGIRGVRVDEDCSGRQLGIQAEIPPQCVFVSSFGQPIPISLTTRQNSFATLSGISRSEREERLWGGASGFDLHLRRAHA